MDPDINAVAVLFCDIVGSTSLYESAGDREARLLCAEWTRRVSDISVLNNGTVIKTMGDGMMISFVTSLDAYNAAVKMQELYQDQALSMTVGINYGPVIAENNDLFGDTVNLAARVAEKARPGEILLTEKVVQQLPNHYRAVVRLLDSVRVKGKEEPVDIYTALTHDVESTISVPYSTIMSGCTSQLELALTCEGKEYNYTEEVLQVVIGRDPKCDLVNSSPYASRQHAFIDFQRDRFVLTDQSSNGTFISNDDASEVFLKRESTALFGNGVISLGRRVAEGAPFLIRFSIRSL